MTGQQPIPAAVPAASRSELAEKPWQAAREAERCLGCHDAPCIAACPTGIDVPRFIGRVRTGNLAGAHAIIRAANALPAICALVCPTEYLCEGACLLSHLEGRAVNIATLQYYVCSQAAAGQEPGSSLGTRVAVVGGGPSGLACALTLRQLGHDVDVFDRHPKPGGLATYSIPGYRLSDAAVETELECLSKASVNLYLETDVTAPMLTRLAADYDAIYLAVGMSAGDQLKIPGETLRGVWPALDFLETARRWRRGEAPEPDPGPRVVVIGGGNVAMDAASQAIQLQTREVILLYRRTVEEMPAWHEEYEQAARLGVQFRWLTSVIGILGQDGAVRGVRTLRMEPAQIDASGRRVVRALPGSEETLACDGVIVAAGQAVQRNGLAVLGLAFNPDGTLSVDAETGQTARPGVFAGGDAVRGGSYVVQAVADGQRAARGIHRYLAGETAQ